MSEVVSESPKPRSPRARRSDAGAPRSGLALVKLVQASRLPVPDGCLEKAQLDELVALRAGAERVARAVANEVEVRAEKLKALGAP